jgi:hypothetical protein
MIQLEDIPQEIYVEMFKYKPIVDFSLYGAEINENDRTRALKHTLVIKTGLNEGFKIRGEFNDEKIIVKEILSVNMISGNSLPENIKSLFTIKE